MHTKTVQYHDRTTLLLTTTRHIHVESGVLSSGGEAHCTLLHIHTGSGILYYGSEAHCNTTPTHIQAMVFHLISVVAWQFR